jgi:serine/threonine-protein kinase
LTRGEIEAVETALRAILGSQAFKGSERMCRFLRLAAEHALQEDRAPLKEYEIGVNVFDRRADFDPRQDTIVRVEARRLRAKLRQYYENEGADPPVVIDFPERGYVPTFRFRRRAPVRRRRKALIAGACICLSGIAAAVILWSPRKTPAPSLVVLPFLNLSPDPANEYIGDGFTEEITNTLSAIPELRVVARTSAFRFKGHSEDVRAIGERLNVGWVLEGSVRKEADRLRVTAQLVDAGTRLHAWSHTYDATMAGLFEVQGRIAGEICGALKIRLSAAANRGLARSRAVKPEAYEAYLKGRYFWHRLTPEALRKSISYLSQAVQIDPKYAAAHAALADSYSSLPQFELEPPGELLDKCKAAAERALALDSDSPEAHFAVGVARAVADRDPAGAERALLRALELKPNLTAARQAYAVTCLSAMGRHEQSISEMRRVVADDPVSATARCLLGQTLGFAGRLEEAVEEAQLSLELEPGFLYASQALGLAYLAKSRYREARRELERTWEAAKGDPYHAGLLGYTCGRLGDKAGAVRMLEQLTSRLRSYVPPVEVAGIHNGLGQTDEALRWLECAYQDRSPMLLWVAVDPRFASLREDPRFLTLTKRMGLAVRP